MLWEEIPLGFAGGMAGDYNNLKVTFETSTRKGHDILVIPIMDGAGW